MKTTSKKEKPLNLNDYEVGDQFLARDGTILVMVKKDRNLFDFRTIRGKKYGSEDRYSDGLAGHFPPKFVNYDVVSFYKKRGSVKESDDLEKENAVLKAQILKLEKVIAKKNYPTHLLNKPEESPKMKSPLPENLKNVPKGYVYLGKGGEFKIPQKHNPICDFYCGADWSGDWAKNREGERFRNMSSVFYAFPKNSAIVKLNTENTDEKAIAELTEEVRVLKEKIKAWQEWADNLTKGMPRP